MARRREAERPTVAAFVSSHGFGHAARAVAVLEALQRRSPDGRIVIFTGTPRWFFEASLGPPGDSWELHEGPVDLGLVQASALREDLEASVRALEPWAPPSPERVGEVASRLRALGADAVLCDISPLGLAAAAEAGVPSLLVESFTWDWIYDAYREDCPELAAMGRRLRPLFELATRRVQTEPCCGRRADLPVVGPISRRPRADRATVRALLGLDDDAPFVLVTMGGIEWAFGDLEPPVGSGRPPWVVLVGGVERTERRGRVIRLPHRSPIHHPDLVRAADAVIAKLGYSTLAEAWRAGIPVGYVPRPRFPESPVLEAWVRGALPTRRILPEALEDGSWIRAVPEILALPRPEPPARPDEPADLAASILAGFLA